MCLRGQYYTAVVHAKEQIKTDVQSVPVISRRVLYMEWTLTEYPHSVM